MAKVKAMFNEKDADVEVADSVRFTYKEGEYARAIVAAIPTTRRNVAPVGSRMRRSFPAPGHVAADRLQNPGGVRRCRSRRNSG